MEINLDEINDKKFRKLEKEKKLIEYDNFVKKEELKVSLINIDSRFREINPKNVYSTNVIYLPKDPLTLTDDSNTINIYYPNHGFIVGDSIIIQNVESKSYVVNNSLYLFQNNSYLYIKLKNYVSKKYLNLSNKLKIDMSLVSSSSIDNLYFYGNIPINSILGTFEILLPSVINSQEGISQIILDYFGYKTADDMDGNFLLIKLPYNYFSNSLQILEIADFFRITYQDLYGIPISSINADFPINYLRSQSSQIITKVLDKNNFMITSNYVSIQSGTGGGNKIQIMKIINTIEGYPNANNYKLKLKKNFNNVVRIELVSTEFTFVDYLIKNTGPNKNNKIYWKHLDDGDFIYSASIKEGNYDGNNLITEIMNSMNSIQRVTSTVENPIYNNFTISMNSYSQEITFSAFKIDNLPNSLKADIIQINSTDFFRLTIKHPNNLIEVGDVITISNASDLGVMSRLNINKSLIVYEVSKENSSYSVLIGPRNQITTNPDLLTTLTDDGGGAVQITSKARFCLLFNYLDTIGEVLGFKDVGSVNAITPFSKSISNFNLYLNDTNLDSVGNPIKLNNLLNFSGDNNYYLLYINDFELVSTTSNLQSSFAKILLSGQPGDVLYNTFINYPLEFDFPLSTLNELQIKILFPDGTYPDFRNIDHSFTLKITELIMNPYNTGKNSKKTNYLSTMKEIINTNTN